jgi:flagellar secretion chaperone FliS
MNVQIAKDAYSKVKKETSSSKKIGHANVGLALRKLKSSMVNMTIVEENESFKQSYKTALLSIYFLQKSLDFDKGGELANNLFKLYEFCKLTVQDTVMSGQHQSQNLLACSKYIADIIESWEKIYD